MNYIKILLKFIIIFILCNTFLVYSYAQTGAINFNEEVIGFFILTCSISWICNFFFLKNKLLSSLLSIISIMFYYLIFLMTTIWINLLSNLIEVLTICLLLISLSIQMVIINKWKNTK